jgi:membrane protein
MVDWRAAKDVSSKPDNPDVPAPPSDGWYIASITVLAGIAIASKYLLPRDTPHKAPALLSHEGAGDLQPADNEDRGRGATTPYEIPARGWKDILLRVYANVSKHRILALAAGMTYYSILAIFPAIAAVVAIYGLFSDPTTIGRHLAQFGGFMPGGALDVAREQLTRVSSKGTQTLGATFLIGLGVSLWSANAAMKSLFDTLNIVHGEDEKRDSSH